MTNQVPAGMGGNMTAGPMPIFGICGALFTEQEARSSYERRQEAALYESNLAFQQIGQRLEEMRAEDARKAAIVDGLYSISDPSERLLRSIAVFCSRANFYSGPMILLVRDHEGLAKAVTGGDYIRPSIESPGQFPSQITWDSSEVAKWFAQRAAALGLSPDKRAAEPVMKRFRKRKNTFAPAWWFGDNRVLADGRLTTVKYVAELEPAHLYQMAEILGLPPTI